MSNLTLKQIDEAITLAHSEGRITVWTELMDARSYLLGKPVDEPRDPREVMAEVGYK